MSTDSNIIAGILQSFSLFKPETTLVITFVLAIIMDLIFKKSRWIAGIVSIIGFVVAGIFMLYQCNPEASVFSNLLIIDPFSQFFKWVILLSSVIVVFMSFLSDELKKDGITLGEYYTLIVGMTLGMFLLSSASNLIMIYLAIETMSLSSYVLAGYTKEIKRSSEASLKYVIFGSLSSGFMIYGISLLYGLTGSLELGEIHTFLMTNDVSLVALSAASLLIVAGFGYKISAVPFHFWTPDVYEGAPVTITAYLSVASKAAGFAVLIRFLKMAFLDSNPVSFTAAQWVSDLGGLDWQWIMATLAILTMTLGNLVAVWQTNVKRMLAYSSIAHAGYLLMGVVVMTDAGITSVLLYFIIYMVMNLGAFLVVMLIANKTGSEEIDDYVGLGYRAPVLGVVMAIFLFSLTGLPPTAGFIGKWYLFMAVIEAGWTWLAVIAVLNSVVSLYYYVKVLRNMWIRGMDVKSEPMFLNPGSHILLYALAVPTLFFGLYLTPFLEWAKNSIGIFLGV